MPPDSPSTPPISQSRPNAWLLGEVLPWWRERIVDPDGGYFEALDATGAVVPEERRTTLTQARLLYVFSHAYLLTRDPAMLEAALHGRRFLEAHCRSSMNGGWYRAVSSSGAVLDPVHDAYDHAFVLFAFAWLFRATEDASLCEFAATTSSFLDRWLGDPQHGGYREEWGTGPRAPATHRRQNPHMHLLEAWLAWQAIDATGPWLAYAEAMADLFEQRFLDAGTGTLIEYFNADWTPAAGAAGQLREPGHHFEWIWLLHRFQDHAQRPSLVRHAERLWHFGTTFGIERDMAPVSLAFDGVDAAGRLVADTKLLWPQTELLKACAARVEDLADESARTLGHAAYDQIRAQYFDAQGVRWVNQLTRDGRTGQDIAPARILYHVVLAVTEWDRVTGELPRQ